MELQMHTQAIMQNAVFKKKFEVEQHEQRRRQEMHKQHDLESSSQQHQQRLNSSMAQQIHHSSRHINSPTPLAFTPTSVLRKMTAEKESTPNSSQTSTISLPSPQQIPQHAQQSNLKLKQFQQVTYFKEFLPYYIHTAIFYWIEYKKYQILVEYRKLPFFIHVFPSLFYFMKILELDVCIIIIYYIYFDRKYKEL